MNFINHKKSRVTDLFRKMDKNHDEFVQREDFIDGIVNSSNEFILFDIYWCQLHLLYYYLQGSLRAAWK